MTFGQYVRQQRERRNLSLDTVAQVLGYEHRSNVHRLETGKLEWKLSSVEKLAELFVTVFDINYLKVSVALLTTTLFCVTIVATV